MILSANLGFLWTDRSLPDAIRAAANAGFDAVECHFPYAFPTSEISQVLEQTNLPMLGLNTAKDDGMGYAALPDSVETAREKIDQAINYAADIGTKMIHVMAGDASGAAADQTFLDNIDYAAQQAQKHDQTILIEPLNHRDAPNYYLRNTAQAIDIINDLAHDNVRLMFDCYHIQIVEGDISNRLEACLPYIGHVQIAGVPRRDEPQYGELAYPHIISHLSAIGYSGAIGAEYIPRADVESGLDWMTAIRAQA